MGNAHPTLNYQTISGVEAIRQAAPVRLKAIFMNTLTTMIVIVCLAFYLDLPLRRVEDG